jgi:hypothetical protein
MDGDDSKTGATHTQLSEILSDLRNKQHASSLRASGSSPSSIIFSRSAASDTPIDFNLKYGAYAGSSLSDGAAGGICSAGGKTTAAAGESAGGATGAAPGGGGVGGGGGAPGPMPRRIRMRGLRLPLVTVAPAQIETIDRLHLLLKDRGKDLDVLNSLGNFEKVEVSDHRKSSRNGQCVEQIV